MSSTTMLTETGVKHIRDWPRMCGEKLSPRERCLALATLLEHIPVEQFTQRWWVWPVTGAVPGGLDTAGHYTAAPRTLACTAGWATWLFCDEHFFIEEYRVCPDGSRVEVRRQPVYRTTEQTWKGYVALTHYFDLTDREVRSIFRESLDPRDVAAQLRNVHASIAKQQVDLAPAAVIHQG